MPKLKSVTSLPPVGTLGPSPPPLPTAPKGAPPSGEKGPPPPRSPGPSQGAERGWEGSLGNLPSLRSAVRHPWAPRSLPPYGCTSRAGEGALAPYGLKQGGGLDAAPFMLGSRGAEDSWKKKEKGRLGKLC